VIAFACDNAPHNRVGQELAEQAGIGVRTGCFCAHLLVKRLLNIHPLRARLADLFMLLLPGFTAPILPGLVRISFGLENNGRILTGYWLHCAASLSLVVRCSTGC
jgi:selenocysteine lyase/cysteine desulfurase